MYLDAEKVTDFLGTGQKNENGLDLITFLEKYDPKKYDSPSNTVDTLVFTYSEKNAKKTIDKVLLIKRGNHPSIGWWALPGGFVDYREDVDHAALRELQEETGVENIEIEQLKSYGAYDRDPRTRIITTAYVSIIPEGSAKVKAGDDASDSGWFDISIEKIDQSEDPEKPGLSHELYKMILSDANSGVTTKTIIDVTERTHSILKNRTYTVKETNLLAADHGAIILEGYQYLLDKLK